MTFCDVEQGTLSSIRSYVRSLLDFGGQQTPTVGFIWKLNIGTEKREWAIT